MPFAARVLAAAGAQCPVCRKPVPNMTISSAFSEAGEELAAEMTAAAEGAGMGCGKLNTGTSRVLPASRREARKGNT